VGGAYVIVAPPDTPHGFVNTGDEPLGMVAIHVSPRFVTEWLD
jgi:quercetin dioxygenase-like cupin family protein